MFVCGGVGERVEQRHPSMMPQHHVPTMSGGCSDRTGSADGPDCIYFHCEPNDSILGGQSLVPARSMKWEAPWPLQTPSGFTQFPKSRREFSITIALRSTNTTDAHPFLLTPRFSEILLYTRQPDRSSSGHGSSNQSNAIIKA